MIERLQFIRNNNLLSWIFFLFVLFLPTQFGKHFWPDFAFIFGQRIDYYSPTLYATDILASAFITVAFLTKNTRISFRSSVRCALVLLFLSFGIFFSRNPAVGWYKLVKLVEFLLLGYTMKNYFASKKNYWSLYLPLSCGVFFESSIALMQFFKQSSLGGMLYYLGERTFTGDTPGIANTSVYGQLVLRPYATFSHPNVLAAYLVLSMICLLFPLMQKPLMPVVFPRWKKVFFVSTIVLGTIALVVSLSRVAILMWIISLCVAASLFLKNFLFPRVRPFMVVLLGGGGILFCVGILLLIPLLRYRFLSLSFSNESIADRYALTLAAWQMITTHTLLGVGFGNFLEELPFLLHLKRAYLLLQPVHNIFLLTVSETGIPGFVFTVWFLYKTGRRLLLYREWMGMLLFMAVIFLGQFDHYFLTLQQGQLLLTLVFSLSWRERS